MAAAEWDVIESSLPTERTPEDRERRQLIFEQFDPNGNGYLSLAECDKGCRDVLGIYEIYEAKPVIMRAFQAAKGAGDENVGEKAGVGVAEGELQGSEYVSFTEFRLFLLYLKQYLSLYRVFKDIDQKGESDRRLTLEEFKTSVPLLEEKGVEIDDADAVFAEIDANGGGFILFDEFAHWGFKHLLKQEGADE